MPRVNRQDPAALRAQAQRLRTQADAWSTESQRRLDAAPGGFVTGRSGRTAAQDRKTNAAIERSLDLAKLIVAARKRADALEARAVDIETGGAERRQRQRSAAQADERDAAKAKRAAMKADPGQRLFIACYPAGLMYCDKMTSDYQRVAFLPYSSLTLEIEPHCPAVLRPLIEADAAQMQACRGEAFQIAGNAWATLGEPR